MQGFQFKVLPTTIPCRDTYHVLDAFVLIATIATIFLQIYNRCIFVFLQHDLYVQYSVLYCCEEKGGELLGLEVQGGSGMSGH